mmetsp:Transcript_15125/g.17613  ORF Transcript_15125/g.17613 Transcript_15125/m.17613 type:complete len:443 (+) Transcript_15125:182-1510(+)
MKLFAGYENHSAKQSTSAHHKNQRKMSKKNKNQINDSSSKASTTMSMPMPTEDTLKSYPKWHNFVAGAAAGAGARLFTAPLDLIKIRRQLVQPASSVSSSIPKATTSFSPFGLVHSFRHIVKTEGGITSLFRGNLAATYLWIGYAAVQFSLYARTSDFLTNTQFSNIGIPTHILSLPIPAPIRHTSQCAAHTIQNITSNPTAVAFCSGAIAGTAATITTYPFDICRTAFAARGLVSSSLESKNTANMKSFFKLATQSAREAAKSSAAAGSKSNLVSLLGSQNPLRYLFAGCGPAVIGIIPYMGLNFALYDFLVRKGGKTKVGDAGVAGAIAGGTSKLIVYPLDTVKKRLQAQAFNQFWLPPSSTAAAMKQTEYKNMVDCAMKVMKEEGVSAFYRGLVPTLMKTMAATGLTFAIFTFTKNSLETVQDWCELTHNWNNNKKVDE